MPPITRLARLAISPAVRGAVMTGLRSPRARDVARRAVRDPKSAARHLAEPAILRDIAGSAALRSAARGVGAFAVPTDELPTALRIARAGLVLVPLRWMPAAWFGLWAVRRLSRSRGGRGRPAHVGRPPGI